MSLTIDCGEGKHDLCIGWGTESYLFPQQKTDPEALPPRAHSCSCHCHSEELEDAEFVSAADLPDDMFPEWDATAELADDARRGK